MKQMYNNNEKTEARERIIKAVLDIIGRTGTIKVTVREIAKIANVNLAAVNYYFRSTDNLLKEVEKYFSDKVYEVNLILADNEKQPLDILREWTNQLILLLVENPGILWIIANKIVKKDSPGILIEKFIDENLGLIRRRVSQITGSKDDALLTFKATQIMSGITFPVIMYNGFGKNFGQDFSKPDVIKMYTEFLIREII